jgi:hypothetical protein
MRGLREAFRPSRSPDQGYALDPGILLETGPLPMPEILLFSSMQETFPHVVEALIAPDGRVMPLVPIVVDKPRRALITVLDEAPQVAADHPALLSSASLARDWDRPEEDAAWSHLQPARSF